MISDIIGLGIDISGTGGLHTLHKRRSPRIHVGRRLLAQFESGNCLFNVASHRRLQWSNIRFFWKSLSMAMIEDEPSA